MTTAFKKPIVSKNYFTIRMPDDMREKIQAEAEAYAVEIKAKADAEQTRLIASAIKDDGQEAINFEVLKRQVDALGKIASSNSSKTIIMPTEITGVIGSLDVLIKSFKDK